MGKGRRIPGGKSCDAWLGAMPVLWIPVTHIQGWRGQPQGTGQDQPGKELGAPASVLQEWGGICSSRAPDIPKTSQLEVLRARR